MKYVKYDGNKSKAAILKGVFSKMLNRQASVKVLETGQVIKYMKDQKRNSVMPSKSFDILKLIKDNSNNPNETINESIFESSVNQICFHL